MKKLILLIPFLLIAYVNVSVNKQKVYPGEEVVFTIQASGNDIKFPNIKKIAHFPVQGTAIMQNITILNGNMQKNISKSYIFFPTKDVTIPSFEVFIDNKAYKTKPIHIKVLKPVQSKDANFKLLLSVNKQQAYIEEPLIFSIEFFQKDNINPQSIEIRRPNFDNFFTKKLSTKTFKKDGYTITKYNFLLIPQKTGNFQIGPILAKIGYLKQEKTNDPFFNLIATSIKYKNIFSNEINVSIKPIPKNTIFGEFNASLISDKTKVKANEPVNVTLNIKGCGDFYNLPQFKLNIPNVTIYPHKPIINTFIKDNTLCGEYTKNFTVISDHNISIKPIEFNSFKTKIIHIKTNPLLIEVKSYTPKYHSPKIITKEKVIYKVKKDYTLSIIMLVVGILIGFGISKIEIKKEPSVIKKIKKANDKELFNILLEYSNNPQIEEILKKLEENIYQNKKNRINKREIIKILKNL